jgi:hypothetical protein
MGHCTDNFGILCLQRSHAGIDIVGLQPRDSMSGSEGEVGGTLAYKLSPERVGRGVSQQKAVTAGKRAFTRCRQVCRGVTIGRKPQQQENEVLTRCRRVHASVQGGHSQWEVATAGE